MRKKFVVAFLCCFAVVTIVQSETTIEFDENGDEYEVKTFNIQGRQLNGGPSQCVMTRRKRSTATDQEMSNNSNDNGSSSNDNLKNPENDDMLISTSETSPATGIDTNTEDDDMNFDGDELSQNVSNLLLNGSQMGNNVTVPKKPAANDYDYDYDYENESGDLNQESIPIKVQKQVIKPYPQVTEQVAIEHLNANGIVVYESDEPPKVNPDTHAVFQLLPVNHAIHAAADSNKGNNGQVHFQEEISPITTTAIWSTGDDNSLDDSDDLYDDYGLGLDYLDIKKDKHKPNKNIKKPIRKPTQNNKNKKKISKKPRRPVKKGNRNQRPKKPVVNNVRKNGNKNRRTPEKRKSQNNRYDKNNNRRFNAHSSNQNTKHRKHHNDFVKDKGSRTFTRSETFTQTGTADDKKNVNCIIIRKDPPPTTPQPLWGLFGRNANGTGRSTQFGKRKRIIRLVPRRNNDGDRS